MKKVKFKCYKCNGPFDSVLDNTFYDEELDEYYILYEGIDYKQKIIQAGFLLNCHCGESFDFQDIINQNTELNRNKKLNKLI